ncbi:MAG TPA: hypothetical protein VKB67_11050 [Rhizomicrobium sp.]|nr:hypothetical protein [Rhizomicrobium sp.]
MRTKFGALALAIVTTTVMGTSMVRADVDPDQVKVAYADGYMATDGQFHAWEHRADAEQFRAKHLDRYHPWRHDAPGHKNDQ